MRRRAAISGLALISAMACGRGAVAQAVLEPGVWVTGALEPTDSCDFRGRVYDRYSLPVGFVGLLRITVESAAFDATVRVEAPLGEVVEVLGDSDDAPGLANATDARAYALVRSGQVPTVQVRSWAGDLAGSYRIRMDPLPRVSPRPELVEYGADIRGALEETDAFVNGVFEDRFRFQGREGDHVRVVLQSEDFDAFVEMWHAETGLLAQDDDGFEIDDAWIDVVLPSTGMYDLRIRPSPALPPSRRVMLGEYRLRLGPGLEVEPDPTLGGLAFTDEERLGLRYNEDEVWHDALGFRFPSPTGRFTVTNAFLEAPETQDAITQVWHLLQAPSGDELVVMATRAPEPLTEVQLHRVAKRWVEVVGTPLLEERLDHEGARSLFLRLSHPFVWNQAMEIRCRTSGPERTPALLVCLWDGGSFRGSLAGLEVR